MKKVINLTERPNSATILFQFVISSLIVLSSTLVISSLGLFIASLVYDLPFTAFQIKDWANAPDIAVEGMKIVQVISQFGMFIIPAILIPLLVFKVNPIHYTGLQKDSSFLLYGLALLSFFTLSPLIILSVIINQKLQLPESMQWLQDWLRNSEDLNNAITVRFIEMKSVKDLLINTFVIAVVPAIAEEMFFRGFVQRTLVQWFRKKHLAVIFTAAFFSFIHFQFFGFLPRFLLGLLLGYVFLWSGNLKLAIFIHFLNNFSQLLQVYFEQQAGKPIDINEIPNFPGITYVLSAVIGGVLLFAFYKNAKKRKHTEDEMEEDDVDNHHLKLNVDENWQRVYATTDLYRAEIILGNLRSEGIKAVIINKKDSAYSTFGEAEIHVPLLEKERALQIIES